MRNSISITRETEAKYSCGEGFEAAALLAELTAKGFVLAPWRRVIVGRTYYDVVGDGVLNSNSTISMNEDSSGYWIRAKYPLGSDGPLLTYREIEADIGSPSTARSRIFWETVPFRRLFARVNAVVGTDPDWIETLKPSVHISARREYYFIAKMSGGSFLADEAEFTLSIDIVRANSIEGRRVNFIELELEISDYSYGWHDAAAEIDEELLLFGLTKGSASKYARCRKYFREMID